jgi:tripartite-type tricarboxylate transporter receptor subunit TctC
MPHSLLHRRQLLAFSAGLAALSQAPRALAQPEDWPARQPIKVIIPGPAGGAMDIYMRLLQAPLQAALKQTLVLDYKPGANSIIGIDAVAKAPADGYTLLIVPSSAVALNPLMVAKLPYDTQRDLTPVAQVGAAGTLLVAHPGAGFKNLADVVAYARANPGKLSVASWGNGSTGHLALEGLKAHYNLQLTHVPYKTTAQEVTDLMAGVVPLGFTDIASPLPHLRSGKLVAVGATGSGRGPALPEVPTLSEQGFKFDTDGWFGIFAPAGTPAAIVQRLNQEFGQAMALDEVKKRFASQNMGVPAHKTAAQFAATVKADVELWQGLGRRANLKAD